MSGVRTVIAKAWREGTDIGIAGARFFVSNENFTDVAIANQDGIGWFLNVPDTVHYFNSECTAEGYDTVNIRVEVGEGEFYIPPYMMKSSHFDPSIISVPKLLAICGSMWTRRSPVPYGPRPGQPTNIDAMDYYEFYPPEHRARMIADYIMRNGVPTNYTHYVTGPVVDAGYHGYYPSRNNLPTQEEWDWYLDSVQERYDQPTGPLIPIHFAKPDNWSLAQMEQLVPFYLQPRAQRLLRIIVWTGWEPWGYDLTNAQWNEWFARGRQVMPNALHLVHTVCDIDACTGGDDHLTLGSNGNAVCWQRSAHYLDGWLMQLCGYQNGGNPILSDQIKANYVNHFHDMARRFHDGYNGWPTYSARGPQYPLKMYAAEYAAYPSFHHDWPEGEAVKLGDACLEAGADGYLDGGSLIVIEGQ